MELRGHEHVAEVITFAPIAAYPAIRELAGIPVRIPRFATAMTCSQLMLREQNTDRTKRHGLYVATGARDRMIKLWDTQSGQMLRNLVCCGIRFFGYIKMSLGWA
jgi:platelet-activating factor acetylhydrolase IB subunit alpha